LIIGKKRGQTTCIDDQHGLTPCAEMVKGIWRNFEWLHDDRVQKRSAGNPTRVELTTLPQKSFKISWKFLKKFQHSSPTLISIRLVGQKTLC
jgi:hypothetical protein